MPLHVFVVFKSEYVHTEQEALNTLPLVHGKVEIEKVTGPKAVAAFNSQEIFIARTQSVNVAIIAYYLQHRFDPGIGEINWLYIIDQGYPHFFYVELYFPLWVEFFKLAPNSF